MKVARFQDGTGTQFWAALDANRRHARRFVVPLLAWAPVASVGGDLEGFLDAETIDPQELKLLAPLEPGARIFGVGGNYPTHLEDVPGGPHPIPSEMPAYLKLESTIINPGEKIRFPGHTRQLDYEAEIVAVVARPLTGLDTPVRGLLGYTLGNDVSVRDVGRPVGGPDLYSMKAQDGTTPIGPWIVTLDEAGGPGQPGIEFSLRVNGELRQRDDSSLMIFPVDAILRWIDRRNKLRCGDVIFTGTTGGTGIRDGRFLNEGDLVQVFAETIGTLSNEVGEKEALVRADAGV